MLTENEKNEILKSAKANEPLSDNLKLKLIEHINNGYASIFEDDEYLCCDLGIDKPDRYKWISFENCRALGGRAADKSMCGR